MTWHKPSEEETSTRHGEQKNSRGELMQMGNLINRALVLFSEDAFDFRQRDILRNREREREREIGLGL